MDYYDLATSINDSIVEVDSMGNFIRFRYLPNTGILCVQDSDLIVFEQDKISKQDFNGSIRWTYNDSSLIPVYGDTANIFCFRNDTVLKIRTKDGGLVWKKIIPHSTIYSFYYSPASNITICADIGLIVVNGFDISKYDSAGNWIWTKTDSFPSFGYRSVIEDTSGFIITGGAYPCIEAAYMLTQYGFGYFIARLDSNGNGTLDSTDHYFTGNANDNNIVSFSDDAAFIGAAMGNSGSLRPSALQSFASSYSSISVFGADWSGQFASGFNYKFSDADGNGIIDTNDIHLLSYSYGYGQTVYPHWRRASTSSSLNNLIIDIVEDTLTPGDSMTILVRLDPSASIDSIYSVSMDIAFYNLQSNNTGSVLIQPNNFGTPGVNMLTYCMFCSNVETKYLISKNDHLNSALNGDTLAKFRIPVINGLIGIQTPQFSYHAITVGGFDVQFNIVYDSVYYYDPATVVNELHDQSFLIVPNPGSGFFVLTSSSDLDELIVMNSEGKIILKKNDQLKNIDLSTQPDGIYFVQIRAGNQLLRKRLTLIH